MLEPSKIIIKDSHLSSNFVHDITKAVEILIYKMFQECIYFCAVVTFQME